MEQQTKRTAPQNLALPVERDEELEEAMYLYRVIRANCQAMEDYRIIEHVSNCLELFAHMSETWKKRKMEQQQPTQKRFPLHQE